MISNTIWRTYTQLGCQAYSNGNYDLAQTIFAYALEEAERDKRNKRRLATSVSNLALACKKQNQIATACGLFKTALSLYENLYGKANLGVLQCLDNIAELYLIRGKYILARRQYKKVIAVLAELFGADHPFLYDRFIKLSLIHFNLKQYDEALAYYARAKAMAARSRLTIPVRDSNELTSIVQTSGLDTTSHAREALKIRKRN